MFLVSVFYQSAKIVIKIIVYKINAVFGLVFCEKRWEWGCWLVGARYFCAFLFDFVVDGLYLLIRKTDCRF